jgi:epimerase transport system membrane fusion protein
MDSSNSNDTKTPIRFNTDLQSQKKAGMIVFILLFGFGGAWAALAPINGAALAPGVVMVRSYSKIVQHLEGGIINDIFVENGARVDAGDPILDLDNTQSLAQLEITNSQYIALKALENRLIAERDGLPNPAMQSDQMLSGARVEEEKQSQLEIFRARNSALEAGVAILEQRIEQLQSQISGLEGLQSSKELLSKSYQEELSDVQELLSQGFSDKNRLREIERNVAQLDGEVAELIANIASTEVQIGESRLQILQQEREFQNQVVTELAEVQTNLNDTIERITAIEDIVSRTVVRAPESGFVNGLQVHTIGGVITPGMRIVDIVPETDDLVIEAKVSPLDVDRIAIGQEATIRFSTFGNGTVPTIFGELKNLSADSLLDETTGASYYLARVEVSQESIGDLSDLTLMPGMPAEVFIATGSRTFLEYLFKPFSNAMARGLRED